jgi:hypothetical protein
MKVMTILSLKNKNLLINWLIKSFKTKTLINKFIKTAL